LTRKGAPSTVALWLALSLAACGVDRSPSAEPRAISITAAQVPLDRTDPGRARVGPLAFLAGFDLTSATREFGGISGLHVEPDGRSMIAVTDRGHWLKIELEHDWQGRLVALGQARIEPILDRAGKPVAASPSADAEGLTPDGKGGFFVSFEQRHRIWRYATAGGPAEPVPGPAGIGELPPNRGIEAMTLLADGRLVAVSEGVEREPGWTVGWFGHPGGWAEFGIEARDGFRPTDLARLPDRRLLLLERYFTVVGGVRARLSVFPDHALSPGARVSPQRLATLEPPLTIDNLEAMSVRQAPDGSTLIYLLSDDNFNALQRNLLLQFRLAE